MDPSFDPDCSRCPRLADFLRTVREANPGYHCRPVAAFGDPDPRILIVGLAPGMHGANRTGRPFTGDYAGILLYETLHRHGLATGPVSMAADDGLRLLGARITNAVKCLPPANKPEPREIATCNDYLRSELGASRRVRVVLALGTVAHGAVLRSLGLKASERRFAHAAEHALPEGRTLLDSYHCSRYNTQTRRLTSAMFDQVIGRAVELAADP
ncbi:MAG: uracil-DNA glycosylase [Steroidobacteraceae bacterium]